MKRDERIIFIAVVCVTSAAALGVLGNFLVLSPLREAARQDKALRAQIDDFQDKNREMDKVCARFAALRDRTFTDQPLDAQVLLATRINQLARQAGLNEENFTASIYNRGTSDAFTELSCRITVTSASPERMVNFLYLLRRDHYLGRVTDLAVTPLSRPGQPPGRDLRFDVRYSTLVFAQPPGVSKVPPRATPASSAATAIAALTDSGRAAYDVIVRRNLFAPSAEPVAAAPRQPAPSPGQTPPPAPPPPVAHTSFDNLVVTGLPRVRDDAEVHLQAPGQDMEKVLKIGDKVPFGQIVLADYRELSLPDKPKERSSSRLILKIGQDFWAVELGHRLGQRRLMRPLELPDELLNGSATSAPAGQTVEMSPPRHGSPPLAAAPSPQPAGPAPFVGRPGAASPGAAGSSATPGASPSGSRSGERPSWMKRRDANSGGR